MSISSDEVNFLVYRYLQESGELFFSFFFFSILIVLTMLNLFGFHLQPTLANAKLFNYFASRHVLLSELFLGVSSQQESELLPSCLL